MCFIFTKFSADMKREDETLIIFSLSIFLNQFLMFLMFYRRSCEQPVPPGVPQLAGGW